jgi:hypothetical protein
VVLDFSSYKRHQIKPVLAALRGKVGLYVYISTDSVYEVARPKQHRFEFFIDLLKVFSREAII